MVFGFYTGFFYHLGIYFRSCYRQATGTWFLRVQKGATVRRVVYFCAIYTDVAVIRTLTLLKTGSEKKNMIQSAGIYFFTARLLSSMQSVIIIATAFLSFLCVPIYHF